MADLPDGEDAPRDGRLDDVSMERPLSAYVHVPFCQVRCGYCDFNTYTSNELGAGATPREYDTQLLGEIALAGTVLEGGRPLQTVFFGGGTPTFLQASQLAHILGVLDLVFGLEEAAEVTTEANPETVDGDYLHTLKEAGFTRVSIGMQSAVPHVLATLDRLHTPARVPLVRDWARDAGLSASLDLIYGTPGESLDDWRLSLSEAIAMEPDHISAYGLGIEPGTKMGQQVKRGLLPDTDPDDLAAKYEIADSMLSAAGYAWYEVSNWAKPGHEARHNIAYWRNDNWWGFGPGAHSHINGTRFWNVKHPRAWSARLQAGESPAAAREILTPRERAEEDIMLGIRLAEGLPLTAGIAKPGQAPARAALAKRRHVTMLLASDGLLQPHRLAEGRMVLTLKGRLLADTVIRSLWE
ncbi:radical SAM family heme chaperone HemW [Flaviflexus equikiangi]|uniref:radical SAM family heme chaperone HemW n=1 Tax=Flaviflexus equikiangi TaxID=2758573 RepID=UPI002175555A|nr:radical SAM family heme chaperone HemW [Flaviflexus equikiangi]